MATPGESVGSETSFNDLADEIIQAFTELEGELDEFQKVTTCYEVGEKLFKLKAFEKALHYANRALTGFIDDNSIDSRFRIVDALTLLAKCCHNLKMYDQSLSYLDQVNTHLTQLLQANAIIVRPLINAHIEMYIVKHKMGNRDEAVLHVLTILNIKQKTLIKAELGDANTVVFDAYLRAFDHRTALPFCLKALEIYEEVYGLESAEFAQVLRKLAVIHHGRKEYKESLDYNILAVSCLQNATPDSPDILSAEVEGACTMIELGRYQEAVDMLRPVVTRDGIGGWLKVRSFLTMAKALCWLDNVSGAERYITEAQRMLEGNAIKDPVLASIGFSDLSSVYKKKGDLETAITMMKTALASHGLPKKLLLTLYEAFMSLISKPAKLSEEVSYLEGELEKLKTRFGLEHCVVGYGHANLGVAYFGSLQKAIGVKSFESAKAILDNTLGSYHLDSLRISHCLSLALATQGRYNEALKVEERVIEGINVRAQPSDGNFLERATKHLNRMKGIFPNVTTQMK